MATYGELFDRFLESTQMSRDLIEDYRPCMFPYVDSNYNNPEAIRVWLKDGRSLIFLGGNVTT